MTKDDAKILSELIHDCLRNAEDASHIDENEYEITLWRERARVLYQLQSETANRSVCSICHPRLPLKLEYATNNVPWVRKGYPGSVRTPESTDRPWKKDIANIGACRERLYSDSEMIQSHAFGVAERG